MADGEPPLVKGSEKYSQSRAKWGTKSKYGRPEYVAKTAQIIGM